MYVEAGTTVRTIEDLQNCAKKKFALKKAETHLKAILEGGKESGGKVSRHMLHYDVVLKIVSELDEEKSILAARHQEILKEKEIARQQLLAEQSQSRLCEDPESVEDDFGLRNEIEQSKIPNYLRSKSRPSSASQSCMATPPVLSPMLSSNDLHRVVRSNSVLEKAQSIKLMKQLSEERDRQLILQKITDKEKKLVLNSMAAETENHTKQLLCLIALMSRTKYAR